ncbi:MAG: hypothetical protein JF606_22690 [Burkholderiales bacterium]|nr:hypothetical protein [Burkholderiales bacterium]
MPKAKLNAPPKAKINFEVDEESLSNAKAYVAKHGGSLNKLVSSLFASLGQDERLRAPVPDPAKKILLDLSSGKVSLPEATRLLTLPDAGYTLRRLADEGLPLPRLPNDVARRQAQASLEALSACLVTRPVADKKPRRKAAA